MPSGIIAMTKSHRISHWLLWGMAITGLFISGLLDLQLLELRGIAIIIRRTTPGSRREQVVQALGRGKPLHTDDTLQGHNLYFKIPPGGSAEFYDSYQYNMFSHVTEFIVVYDKSDVVTGAVFGGL